MGNPLKPAPTDRRFRAQIEVATHAADNSALPEFFGRLTKTIAGLVGAESVIFGVLDTEGSIRGQVNGFGVDNDLLAQLTAPCRSDGDGLAERVVFRDESFLAEINDDPMYDPYRDVIKFLGIRNAICVPWRVGLTPLGFLVAFNSTSDQGFTDEDLSVLLTTAHSAGLVWQQRQALDETMEARESAEEASRSKSEFLSRMSHELRTPLTAIIGYADLLLMEPHDPRDEDALNSIMTAGEHLLTMVNDVLDIVRIEAGHLQLAISPIKLRTVCENALAQLSSDAAGRNVRLHCEVDASLHVNADESRLHQVIINLMSNAIKYSGPDGDVHVDAKMVSEDHLRLSVRDSGPGLQPKQIEKLFQPFERLGAEMTAVPGTGLGLTLARQLIEGMGGKMGVDSVPDKGSTFWFDLPASPRRPTSDDGDAADSERLVLYVDDNLSTLGMMQNVFAKRAQIRLITAMQGGIAIDLARSHHPDLIVLDLNLPDLSGDEVVSRLRADEITKYIPIMVVSADATRRRQRHLEELGVSRYITKPIRIAPFLEIIDDELKLSAH